MARKNWTYLDEFERKHRQLLGAIERRIQRSFQGLHLATSQVLENVPFDSIDLATGFDLSRFPYIEAQIDALTERTQKEILKTIQEAVRSTYAISTAKAIQMTTKYLGADASQLYINTLQRAGSATAFQGRWFNNHPISERVWNITSQFKREVEDRITTDLLNGVPADEVSRNIRGFLNEPNRLYRRVRGADGVLRLSKNARAYHPGQGVYRSSYKNARRLAVTEVNNAYRKADSDRWQQLDFVIGVRVQLSNNHTYRDHKGHLRTLVDICDDLKGDYPKDFVFTSWHPHCRCIATPILKGRAEMKADRERILRGEEPTPSPNEIKEMPTNFKQWQKTNASRIQGAMERDTLPHWYRDNQAVIGGVQVESKSELSILERAKQRHDARTPEQIEGIKERWSDRAKWNQTLVEIQKINAESIAAKRARKIKNPTPPIAYNEVKPLRNKLSEKAIIGRLSGGDLTKGSCSSLAMAYAGNVNGLNVKDFRGGESQKFFSKHRNIADIVKKTGGTISKHTDGFKSANELLKTVVEGKRYYFKTGGHAAIVRRNNGVLEYLELQARNKKDNIFKTLDDSVLKKRFKVKRYCYWLGETVEQESTIVDIDNFKDSDGFKKALGYINTASIKQKKGLKGSTK